MLLYCFVISLVIKITSVSPSDAGADKFGKFKQAFGHANIRQNAYMFWWLFYTTAEEVTSYTDRPLIIWLQGGPGMPSSGYGNFVELGPLDINYNEKDYSLIQDYNVLFIDNPVGVGYSYVSDNNTKIPSNNEEIGQDLVRFINIFMEKKSEFQTVPLYIFGESYGGKMAVEFAYQLMQLDQSQVKWNLKGIGLGNSYISPIDYIRSYGPFALHMGLVDKQGFKRIDELAKQIEILINKKDYEEANDVESMLMNALVTEMPGIDVYNIVIKTNNSIMPSCLKLQSRFMEIMNGDVKSNLSLDDDLEWMFISNDVYYNLQDDIMTSVTDKVEHLLNTTDLSIFVYNGVLDLLVNSAGTRSWMDNLNWPRKYDWLNCNQTPFQVDDMIEGYVKKIGKLILYIIFRAGHSVPVDNMAAFRKMLHSEIGF